MIELSLHNRELKIKFTGLEYAQFTRLVSYLKKNHFRYEPKGKIWYGPAYKYKDTKEAFEDIDWVKDEVDQKKLSDIMSGPPEVSIERIERIPDYSLMNYPPMKGKHPYENFQAEGISKGINRSRYAYFWEMGTGKSYVAAAIIAHRLYKYHDAKKVLFLTTSIGVRNLKHELKKFIKNLDESKVAIGDKDNRLPFTKDVDIVICSYNSFRLIGEAYKKQKGIKSKNPRKPFIPFEEWFGGGQGMIILDESHEAANNSSQRGYLVALHSDLFKYRYLFSGTPADQPEKLYNQFKILDNWLVYNLNFTQWKDKMAYLGTRFSATEVRAWKKDELEESNKRFTKAHGNYYKTADLVDLPEYNERRIYLEMKPYHRSLYQQVITADLKASMEKGSDVRDFVNRFPYLMLAVDNPTLLERHEERFDDNLNKTINNFLPSYMEKLDALEDIINDHPKEKILVWAIHPLTIKEIGERFKKCKPICISGETKEEERNNLIEEFKTGDHQLLIANIATLNTSTTITEAKIQVYVERGFNYSNYEQSTRRIYRIGQDRDVTSYILLYDSSLDILVDNNLKSKGKLVEGLVSKKFLTQEDWITIFNCKSTDELEGRFY